jgi:hypothetical protein
MSSAVMPFAPVTLARAVGQVGEGALRHLVALDESPHLRARARREPGAHLPRVEKLPPLVIADEHGIEPGACRLVAADHEHLAPAEFHLEPVAAPNAWLIGGIQALGHYTFKARCANDVFDLRRRAWERRREQDGRREG